jgi:hypothetical protein
MVSVARGAVVAEPLEADDVILVKPGVGLEEEPADPRVRRADPSGFGPRVAGANGNGQQARRHIPRKRSAEQLDGWSIPALRNEDALGRAANLDGADALWAPPRLPLQLLGARRAHSHGG